jgi:hypothetical protein
MTSGRRREALGLKCSLRGDCLGLNLLRLIAVAGSRTGNGYHLWLLRINGLLTHLLARFDGNDLRLSLHHEPAKLVILLLESAIGSRKENDGSLQFCECKRS